MLGGTNKYSDLEFTYLYINKRKQPGKNFTKRNWIQNFKTKVDLKFPPKRCETFPHIFRQRHKIGSPNHCSSLESNNIFHFLINLLQSYKRFCHTMTNFPSLCWHVGNLVNNNHFDSIFQKMESKIWIHNFWIRIPVNFMHLEQKLIQ